MESMNVLLWVGLGGAAAVTVVHVARRTGGKTRAENVLWCWLALILVAYGFGLAAVVAFDQPALDWSVSAILVVVCMGALAGMRDRNRQRLGK